MNVFLYNKAAIYLIIVHNGSLVVSAHYNSKINSAITRMSPIASTTRMQTVD